MTQQIQCHVTRVSEQYTIEIGRGILTTQAQFLKPLASKFAIICDDTSARLHGTRLQNQLVESGLKSSLFTFPHGEQHKTRETKAAIEDQLFAHGFGRDSCVIALGGGVTTDLAGYVAATYCRGIPLVMIPTSLLGMVDASIGGKTGVNVLQGKNMLGCIYQPKKVVIDLSTLTTLPKKELSNGFVEVIKHALVADEPLFNTLEKHAEQLLALDDDLLERVILASCRIKKEIVEHDEREAGKRALLNFGHTIGHALESLTRYSISHGEAVAIGIVVESYLAFKLGALDQKTFERIKNTLRSYQLRIQLATPLPPEVVLKVMSLDKKARSGQPLFVIINGIGSPSVEGSQYCLPVEESLIKNALIWMNDALCCH